jgi:hypothetical protein
MNRVAGTDSWPEWDGAACEGDLQTLSRTLEAGFGYEEM